MKRLLAVAVSLSLGLIGAQSVALAQESVPPAITTTAAGDCVTSGTPGDWIITCGDLGPGSGLMVVTPPVAVDTVPATTNVAPAPAPAPAPASASEPAPVAEPVSDTAGDAVATETAVATPTDQDADNIADALEPEAGLDPTTADTDADHVADGDEFNLYQTDPTIADTDGDGALDGEELFGTHTDPLRWEEGSTATSSEAATAPAPEAAPVAETTMPAETTAPVAADPASTDAVAPPPEGTAENLSATSGGASSLGDGDASAVPGTVTRDGVTLSGAPLLGPDGTYRVSESSPPVINVSGETTGISVVPAPGLETAPAPVTEPASTEATAPVESAEPVAADTAVATPTDQDADNIADAQEMEIGLDPSDPDTDGDGVADGDEGTLYGTDPFAGDSDGDGLMDGDELYVAGTDPLTAGTAGTA